MPASPATPRRSAATVLRLAALALRAALYPSGADTQIVVFSRDRPLQLHALLSSIERHVTGFYALQVQWRASDEVYAQAYDEVFALADRRKRYTLLRETNFRVDLLATLRASRASALMFMVDDLLFTRAFDFAALGGIPLLTQVPSLRLGAAIRYSQVRDLAVPVPPLRESRFRGWLDFSWLTPGAVDWNMPLSVDAHVFDRREMAAVLESLPFRAPNSMEGAIGRYRFWFKYRRGLCPAGGPVVVNFALNRVQTEDEVFPHGDIGAAELLERWRAGLEFDTDAMTRFEQQSCHVVVQPVYRRRSGG